MGVRVDAARDDVLARRVDDGVHVGRQILAQQGGPGGEHGDDLLAVHQDIGRAVPVALTTVPFVMRTSGTPPEPVGTHGFTVAV